MAQKKENYFNDVYFTGQWKKYFEEEDLEEKSKIREEIVVEAGKIALAVINTFKLYKFCDTSELMQESYLKVLNDFEQFDPNKEKKNKASAFIFLTTIIKNHLLTYIFRLRKVGTIIYSESNHDFSMESLLENLENKSSTLLVEDFLNSENADIRRVFERELEVAQDFFISSPLSEAYIRELYKEEIGRDIIDCVRILANINQKKKGLKTVKECMKKKGYREKDVYAYVKKVKNTIISSSSEHK